MLLPSISHSTFRTAALLVAGVCGMAMASASVSAGDRIYPLYRAPYDDPCEEHGGCCSALCRKFKLHCLYCRRACCQKYITLPYNQPDSTIYIPPTMNGPSGANCPPAPAAGAMTAAPVQYGYGMSPAFAPPGTIFIR